MSSLTAHAAPAKSTKFHGKAEQAAKRILEAFETGDLPKALAPITYNGRKGYVCESTFLSCTRPEWPNAWEALADMTAGDYAETNPDNFERWQYMGTLRLALPILDDPGRYGCDYVWVHEFRHRDRPAPKRETRLKRTGRVCFRVPASDDFGKAEGGAK